MSKARTYKENGYTHVRVNRENGYPEPFIDKGFKSYYQLKRDKASLQLKEDKIYEYLTVNKAVKLGY